MLSKPNWNLFLLTIKILKDNVNLLANLTSHTKILYWSGSMPESQLGHSTYDKYHGLETLIEQQTTDEMVTLRHKYGIKP